MSYDAERTRAYFDAFAEREWTRLDATIQGRVKHAVHCRLLDDYIKPGMRVLDIGSGPGRFAIHAVELGARVTVADLSPVQVELAREHLHDHLHGVDGFHVLDVLDLSAFEPESFDAVICFGAVISYTRERHRDALAQLHRVARPDAPVLLSVINLFGYMRLVGVVDVAPILEELEDHVDADHLFRGAGVSYSNISSPEFHQPIVLFTAQGIRDTMSSAGFDVVDVATSNALFPEFQRMPKIGESERATSALVALEVALCRQPGLLDAGGHTIAVGRKAPR